jgi:hypothetical protein
MDTLFAIVVSLGTMFVSDDTKEFFKTAFEEMEQGAKWHYVGMQSLDPTAKSIPGQLCEPETDTCGDPYIIWKLKMPEGD